eukprot:TRINITY_DN26579_c0_g1_i4.p1 TRINITY_DN26579_c0_g1~~TRINITY_DN26579_c0_g1_i4.p1  ORF type:complete len:1254 (+),score=306.26 TRINITY_DN26579_c0_g1_i4:165-3926(+)
MWRALLGRQQSGSADERKPLLPAPSDASSLSSAEEGLVNYSSPEEDRRRSAALKDAEEAALARGSLRWSAMTAEETLRLHSTSMSAGLQLPKVEELLRVHGFNELAKVQPTPFLAVMASFLVDRMLLIMLLAGIINLFGLKDPSTGWCMICGYMLMVIANSIGEWSNVEGGSALKKMHADTARVVRAGKEVDVPSRELVPGDVVVLHSGLTAPADMRVVSCVDLRMDESLLTGESREVAKTAAAEDVMRQFSKNMVYSSTACVSGRGICVVTATGMNAQVGLIAARLEEEEVPLTPLQITMNNLASWAGVGMVILVIVITACCFLSEYEDPAHPCPEDDHKCLLLSSFARALILGSCCVPATLPLMTAMLLTNARIKMEQRDAQVRKTSSIETLGATTTICSDKTGTLTEGRMTCINALTFRNEDAVGKFVFYPTAGFDPKGGLFREEDMNLLVKEQIAASVDRGDYKFPVRNLGDGTNTDTDSRHLRTLLVAASLNSHSARLHCRRKSAPIASMFQLQQLESDAPQLDWVAAGQMSERALAVAAAKVGVGPPIEGDAADSGLILQNAAETYPRDESLEVPFTSHRKMSATVHEVRNEAFVALGLAADVTHVAVIKGALERLLPLADTGISGDGEGRLALQKGFLPEGLKKALAAENKALAEAALRVMIVCIRPLTSKDIARITVAPSILKCQGAGMRVIMITGDQPATAAAVGMTLNVARDKCQARLCSELNDGSGEPLPESEVDELVKTTNVWARARPSDKVTIIQSLQRLGHTVAMTGDGVNDAPALKLADIGAAMGITGTEVAKGSADVVLLSDDFTVLVEAVEEGRRTFSTIQTYVSFYLGIDVAEIFVFASTMLLRLPMPLGTLQIQLLALLAHAVPPLFWTRQPLPEAGMEVPPRPKDASLLPMPTVKWIVLPWVVVWCILWMILSCLAFWQNTGFLYNAEIIGSSNYLAVDHGLAVCEYAGVLRDGVYTEDLAPFHCRCLLREKLWDTDDILVHEQWGAGIEAKSCAPDDEDCVLARTDRGEALLAGCWDRACQDRRVRTLYKSSGTQVLQKLKPCRNSVGKEKWCWKDERIESQDKFLLDARARCNVLGSFTARSMNLVAATVAELLLILSLTVETCMFAAVEVNSHMVVAVASICGALAALIIVSPALPWLGIGPLSQPLLVTSIGFPLLLACVVELLKAVGYRPRMRYVRELARYHSKACAKGELTAWATDAEVEAHRSAARRSLAEAAPPAPAADQGACLP